MQPSPRSMTLERRWLVTVVAFVAISVGAEAGLGYAIAHTNAQISAQTWLKNGKTGAQSSLVEHLFTELEREGGELVDHGTLPRALRDPDMEAAPRAIEQALPQAFRKRWLLVDPSAAQPLRTALPECQGVLRLLNTLTTPRPRVIAWCGNVPMLLARVAIPHPTASLYLGAPLDQAFVDELKSMSLNEIELWGPHGRVATTVKLEDGRHAAHTFGPADVAVFSTPGEHFQRVSLELDGNYTGYLPGQLHDQYAVRLSSTGAHTFDAYAYVAPLNEALGPADLRIAFFVPADLLMFAPKVSGAVMVMLGIAVTIAIALLARRLIRAISRPLKALELAARNTVENDAVFNPTDSGTFELTSLSSSFAAMKTRVEENQHRAVQSEKMAALGQLAGGVAHEINNPLGVILGFAQGLERRVPEGDALRMPVTSIVREALRCKSLVQELLTFSRVSKKTDEPVEMESLIQSSVLLLGARAKTQGVELVTDLKPVSRLRGSRTQLQQVVVNLGTNALDAMKHGGRLEIRCFEKEGHVVLEVGDTGTGIPPELFARVFEPFFTTKPVGEGTGLGLSLVYQIAQQHHGRIDLVSSGPHGTVMRVTLPVPVATAATPVVEPRARVRA